MGVGLSGGSKPKHAEFLEAFRFNALWWNRGSDDGIYIDGLTGATEHVPAEEEDALPSDGRDFLKQRERRLVAGRAIPWPSGYQTMPVQVERASGDRHGSRAVPQGVPR